MKKIGRPRRVPGEVSNVKRTIRLTPSEDASLCRLAGKISPLTYLRDMVVGFLSELEEQ